MRNEKIAIIVGHFGVEKQIEKLKEECLEFLADSSEEEIADIYNVVTGIHDVNPKIQRIAEAKQKRTIHRITTMPDYF